MYGWHCAMCVNYLTYVWCTMPLMKEIVSCNWKISMLNANNPFEQQQKRTTPNPGVEEKEEKSTKKNSRHFKSNCELCTAHKKLDLHDANEKKWNSK